MSTTAKYSIVIELDYPYGDELLCSEIEHNFGRTIEQYLDANDLKMSHLEVSAGSLHDAFGLGDK